MQDMGRRLAVEEEGDVMNKHTTPNYGERLDHQGADALFHALRGVTGPAARVHANMSATGIVDDPAAGMVTPAAIAAAQQEAIRLPAIRDVLVAGHPVADRMLKAIAADRDRVPVADPVIVEGMAKLDGFAFDGLVVTIDGVPLPAGEPQTGWFMATRYYQLYGPGTLAHLVYRRDVATITDADREALGIAEGDQPDLAHLLAYDASHTTDDMQEALLFYGTGTHRTNLVQLQQHYPALYVALWRRDMTTAKKLMHRLRNAALPPSNPKSRLRWHSLRLRLGTAVMNEHERLSDVIEAVRVDHGVTRQSLAAALKAARSMAAVQTVGDDTNEHLAGSVAQVRSLHPTMNEKQAKPRTADPILERARTAHANTRGFNEQTRRIRWIDDTMPGAWFCGVEPAFLAPVALIQMIANMARREKNFWLRGTRDQAPDVDEQRRSLAIRLAVVITANICTATARSMLPADKVDKQLAKAGLTRTDEEWLHAVVPNLIANPRIAEAVEKRLARVHDDGKPMPKIAILDEDERPHHSSPYERAQWRTEAFFGIGQPGWTQGFFFEAWLRSDAEIAFLTNCCRYIQHSEIEEAKRRNWDAALNSGSRPGKKPVTSVDVSTGLPRQHPRERIQDLFRDLFDRLQIADLVPERYTADQRAWRDAIVREVAPLLAAVSPVTLDPQRAEWWWDDLEPDMKAIAAEAAWNT